MMQKNPITAAIVECIKSDLILERLSFGKTLNSHKEMIHGIEEVIKELPHTERLVKRR